VKNLEAFAKANKQTQGKFTIADEKVSLVMIKHAVILRESMTDIKNMC
jgi:hypothetical protein